MTTVRTVLTVAALTVHEGARRRVLRALGALTVVLLALGAWGFSSLAMLDSEFSEQPGLLASLLLNLVLFGVSLIAALGTALLAGPTLAGEFESGMALAVLARPVRRSAVLLGKWLGLVAFGGGFVVVAGLAQVVTIWAVMGYWPPHPVAGLALLAAQTAVLLTLGLLLSTLLSPMASGIVAIGLFGTTWIAGVLGGIGAGIGPDGLATAGTVSRMLLPTDGLWRGAMHAFQDTSALSQFGTGFQGFPFLSDGPPTLVYLVWVVLWVVLVLGLAAAAFARRDLLAGFGRPAEGTGFSADAATGARARRSPA
jgi:ABC-type transport system involved in multi-copper enzyme maturation permease subunit